MYTHLTSATQSLLHFLKVLLHPFVYLLNWRSWRDLSNKLLYSKIRTTNLLFLIFFFLFSFFSSFFLHFGSRWKCGCMLCFHFGFLLSWLTNQNPPPAGIFLWICFWMIIYSMSLNSWNHLSILDLVDEFQWYNNS